MQPDHDQEDRAVLALVGAYRVGTILDALPDPEIGLAHHGLRLDARELLVRLRGDLDYTTRQKDDILTSLPRLTQAEADRLLSALAARRAKLSSEPPKSLWYRRMREWDQAFAWCRLEASYAEERDREKAARWRQRLCSCQAEQVEALYASVAVAGRPDVPAVWRLRALEGLGRILNNQGRYQDAAQALDRAAHIANTPGLDPLALCDFHYSLGETLRLQGRNREALATLTRASRLAFQHRLAPQTCCQCLFSLGQAHHRLGDRGKARKTYERAVALAGAKLPRTQTHCTSLKLLADILLAQADYTAAEEAAEAATQIASEEGLDDLILCNCRKTYARILQHQGRLGEAEEQGKQAVTIAEQGRLGALTRCGSERALAYIRLRQGLRAEAMRGLARSRRLLFEHLAGCGSLDGTPDILATYGGIFADGRRICEGLLRCEPDRLDDLLWEVVAFWDAEKCVSVRERLRRHASKPRGAPNDGMDPPTWAPGPDRWRDLFEDLKPGDPRLNRAPLRGIRSSDADAEVEDAGVARAAHEEEDPDKARFGQSVTRAEVGGLLQDDHTVILGMYFDRADLVVLPVRKHPLSGLAEVVHSGGALFRVPGVLGDLEKLCGKQRTAITDITTQASVGEPPDRLNDVCDFQQDLYAPLYRLLRLDELLEGITRGWARREGLHLVVIPDGPLFEVPLHAAYDEVRRQHLFEQVASVSYALSLRTAVLQREIDLREAGAPRTIRGTVFVYPGCKQKGERYLGYAREEVAALVRAVGIDSLEIHGERQPQPATRANHRERHGLGNLCWHVGHGGFAQGAARHRGRRGQKGYAFLLADGPLSDVRMRQEGYDFRPVRLVHFSACLLGQLNAQGGGRELEGMTASLALLGCRRVCSALWELCDAASAAFAGCWVRALKEHAYVDKPEAHAFAVAFKRALTVFRELRHWDHGFYWAPYVLYGYC